MSNSDVKILRDELAKIIADNKKKDSVIEEQVRALEEGKKTTAELIMKIDMLERRLVIYENAHSPPSHNSVPAQQKKARSAKGTKPSEQVEGKTAGIPSRKPAIPASPTAEDQRRQYTTGRTSAASAEAPASQTCAPLPSR